MLFALPLFTRLAESIFEPVFGFLRLSLVPRLVRHPTIDWTAYVLHLVLRFVPMMVIAYKLQFNISFEKCSPNICFAPFT